MTHHRTKLLHGTLDALILKTLHQGPRHGYAIARWLGDVTNDAIQVEEGSLYPALYRLERKGLLQAEWGRSELDRRAKFYALTSKGQAKLEKEVQDWARFAEAVSTVLMGEA
ncbi:MAG: PadR family transcriptional regulator [Gemmatimonadota bacterium]|nr:MAG: PadR family transcriptional regulator [Gemmatimonadota bacterium]